MSRWTFGKALRTDGPAMIIPLSYDMKLIVSLLSCMVKPCYELLCVVSAM